MQAHNKICKLPVSVCDRRSVLKGCNQKVSHEKGHNRKRATFCLRVPLVPSSYVLDKTDFIGLHCAPVTLTLAGDHTFCFYPKLPLTFSVFLEIPVGRQLSFSLRMGTAVKCPQYAINVQQCYPSVYFLSVTLSHFRSIFRSISVASFRVDFKNTEQERSHSRYCAEIVQALIEGVRFPMARHNISCKI